MMTGPTRICFAIALLLVPPALVRGQEVRELAPAQRFDGAPFTRIRGVLERGDGTVIVVDQQEKAVWRVDLARGERTQVGRTGGGPDEYEMPTGIGPWAGDSLLITDLGNGRLAILGPDLVMGRALPMFGDGRSLPAATDERGRMYFDLGTALRAARRENRQAGETAAVVRWDGRTEQGDTVARIRIPEEVRVGPFPAWDAWTAGADGRVALVRNQDDYRVDWVMPDGREVRGPVIDEERVPFTGRDRDRWLELHPRGMSSIRMANQPVGERPDVPFPDEFPYAKTQGVWVDASGRAWVERHQPVAEDRPLLDVFDGTGQRVARVRLPARRTVVGFGPGGLWAVHVDEVDLQWLERYDVSGLSANGGGGR